MVIVVVGVGGMPLNAQELQFLSDAQIFHSKIIFLISQRKVCCDPSLKPSR